MSANNFAVVRKFAENDYRWGMFMETDLAPHGWPQDSDFNYGPFKTKDEAIMDAYSDYLEYGVLNDDEITWGKK
jgi:hypothetical protein